MSILLKISSSLGQRDELPNVLLAQEIVASKDRIGIKELADNLNNKNKAIQNDCIKVLYEIGEIQPNLIAEYLDKFLDLLSHKNNRLQWGGMTAVNCIATISPKQVHKHLSQIIDAAEKGSVISRDQAINILINLATVDSYKEKVFILLNEQLIKAPINQLPMYTERMIPIITTSNKAVFIDTLYLRLKDVDKESKRKRLEKVIKKVS